ncbi:hypothetical protein [Lewinella sp. JB7]|uniref:hypothetical protein n=1 Tax=Lewinella sp. JB7 TaxID=2962887 RepID=UPI0020C99AC7|nr:hypothetical protein [Lewinella sp. JB7]MCP9237107.1 hypothetical protein [Lewinella sp. JB7]
MKRPAALCLLLFYNIALFGQTIGAPGTTSFRDTLELIAAEHVRYEDFGARGDGQANDLAAVVAAHAFANAHDLPVRCPDRATYYLGGGEQTAVIQTDTDFGTATFLIDDTEVADRTAAVFEVRSAHQPTELPPVTRLRRGQETVAISVSGPHLIAVSDSTVRHYIRYGLNQDNGSPQTDIFVVDEHGRVDADAPIVWDFDRITGMTALPIDTSVLRVTGGRFVTIANREESAYNYYRRNLAVRRSNVVIDGLEHRIQGEGETGAPYGGFLDIRDCAYVTVRNTVLTGHKTYQTIGSAGKPVSMGSYDILVSRALNVSFINCRQTNDIDDRSYWGIMGSNYGKNLLFDSCTLSRFDAHKGVANATIRNSTLGHMGINAIGSGTLLVENSTVRSRSFVNLRSDYGSTWRGEIVIRNCTYAPTADPGSVVLIGGANTGGHDFGYTCYMPEQIIIEGLHIDDFDYPADYPGPAIFADFNSGWTSPDFTPEFPYIVTERVILEEVTMASNKKLRVSSNPVMFGEVEIIVR